MSNFHPLEVVDRGSETQLQVGENLNLRDFTAFPFHFPLVMFSYVLYQVITVI